MSCRFILDNKCTTPVSDANNGGGTHVWRQGVYGKSLHLLLNVVVNLKRP